MVFVISRRALAHGFCACNGCQPGASALRLMGRAGAHNLQCYLRSGRSAQPASGRGICKVVAF